MTPINFSLRMITLLLAAFLLGSGEGRAQSPTVTPLSLRGLDSLIKARNGRPLVLNLWATWCEPCRKEFPDLIRVSKEFPDVDAAALSVDYPDEVESKILPFLTQMKLALPVYVSAAPKQEDVINFLSPKWSGALPATFIYSGAGARDTFFVGRQSLSQFRLAFRRASRIPE